MSEVINRLNAALEGRYRIERELGEGGMATVYLADDLKHERKVALKVLKPELAAVVGAERFLTEIKTTANLQHPHILPLHDSGDADGYLFYVMPYVEGESLREKLDREHQLPVDEAIKLTTDIAEALGVAHAQGVIHRDIKPANILLSSGRPLVADFGIALAVSSAGADRLTQTGLSIGTPHYMSPEQAAGESRIDARSDIYSVAAMMYEMLAGEPPYTGRTAQVILTKRLTDPVPSVRRLRDKVPASVDAAIQQALAPIPADRFATTAEFISALTTLEVSEPKKPRHWKPWAAAGVAAGLAAALGIGLSMGILGGGGSVDQASRVIAVMPFDNISEDPDNAYIADGLTEEISSQLSRTDALRVMSRTAVEELLAAGLTMEEIGERLGVGTVLQGTVRQAGDQLRITAQLVDVRTNEQLWSGDYDGAVADVFDMQLVVAEEIVADLVATLSPDEASGLNPRRSENPAANAFIELASAAIQARNADGEREAIALHHQAIAVDSTFAWALGNLGWLYGDLFRRPGEPQLSDSAEVFARRSIAADNQLPRGHHALARIFLARGRLSEARLTFLAGQAVTNELGGLGLDLSALTTDMGNLDEGLYWAERVLADSPTGGGANTHYHVGLPLLALGDDERTQRFLDESLEKFPEDPMVSRLHDLYVHLDVSRGRFDDAMRRAQVLANENPTHTGYQSMVASVAFITRADDALEIFEGLYDGESDAEYGYLLIQAGEEERGRQMLDEEWRYASEAYEEGREGWGLAAFLGALSAVKGETEDAFLYLERAYQAGMRDPVGLRLDPMFDSLREHEQFVQLVAQIDDDLAEMRRRAFGREGAMFPDSLFAR